MHTRLILLMLLLVTLGCPTDPGAADDDDATAGDDDDATAGDDDDATAGDDDDATAGDDDDATGVPGPYPPIYIVVNAHGHNYGYTSAVQKISTNNSQYEAHRAEVLWLADETAAYGARMSFQLNGEYARDARLAGDSQEIVDLGTAGHAIGGVHYHGFYFTGANEWYHDTHGTHPEGTLLGWPFGPCEAGPDTLDDLEVEAMQLLYGPAPRFDCEVDGQPGEPLVGAAPLDLSCTTSTRPIVGSGRCCCTTSAWSVFAPGTTTRQLSGSRKRSRPSRTWANTSKPLSASTTWVLPTSMPSGTAWPFSSSSAPSSCSASCARRHSSHALRAPGSPPIRRRRGPRPPTYAR